MMSQQLPSQMLELSMIFAKHQENSCPLLCRLNDGTVVPTGTIAYRLDKVPPSKPHKPFTGESCAFI
jgi:hypothetical protein